MSTAPMGNFANELAARFGEAAVQVAQPRGDAVRLEVANHDFSAVLPYEPYIVKNIGDGIAADPRIGRQVELEQPHVAQAFSQRCHDYFVLHTEEGWDYQAAPGGRRERRIYGYLGWVIGIVRHVNHRHFRLEDVVGSDGGRSRRVLGKSPARRAEA